MGVRFSGGGSIVLVNGSFNSGGPESIIVSSPPLSVPFDSAQVCILWFISLLAGNTAMTYNFRIRRGTAITSPLINVDEAITGPAANAKAIYSGVYIDTPGAVASQQYSLGILGAGGGTNPIINDACMYAFVL